MMMLATLGKTLLKSGAKKIAKDKLLNRKKKKTKKKTSGKEMSTGLMNREVDKKGGALAIQPTTDLVGNLKDFEPVSDTSGESDIVIIRKQVIQVKDILKDSYSAKKEEREEERKARQQVKRETREEKLEKPKVKPKESKGMKVPNLGLGIGNFFAWLAFGIILNKLMELMPALQKIFGVLKPIADFIGGVFNFTVGLVTGFIDKTYAGIEKLEKAIEAIGGEGAKELFEKFGKLFTQVLNAGLIAALIGGRVGLLGKAASLLGFGKTAATTTAVTTATTSTAATVGGMSAGVAAGVVAAAGAIAVGLGEGIFALGKKGYNIEEDWKQKAAKKWWTDPRKYWWGISAGLMGFTNRIFSAIGGIFDVLGAPFRMIAELIRFPFLSEKGKEKQRSNMEKYDTRIREQFRKSLNMFDFLGVINDDKGSWGSLYGDAAGEKASKEMFGEDRKTFNTSVDDSSKPQGFMRGLTGSADFVTLGMFDFDQRNREGAPKDFGVRRVAGGLTDWLTLGNTDFDKRGAGNFQFDPAFGGKDKAWGIESNNTQSKVEGLDTHPSYAQGGMMLIENTTTYIQPVEV